MNAAEAVMQGEEWVEPLTGEKTGGRCFGGTMVTVRTGGGGFGNRVSRDGDKKR